MDPYAPTPEELQSVLASTIRGRDQLTQNNERANRFSNMSAISQLANNPDAARAAIAAHENAQKEYKPVQMGQTGFALPGTGEFVENPIYAEQRLVDKGEKRQALAESIQARKDAQAERLAAQQQMQADRLAAQSRENGLYRTLASVAQANREAATAAKAEAKGAAAADKSSKELDKYVDKYKTDLEKTAIPQFDEALSVAEAVLTKYPAGKDIPGFGRFDGMLHNALLSTDGQMARSDMQAAANVLLKARSGAAVTDGEAKRFLLEIASGAGMSEVALRNGWKHVRGIFEKQKQNITSGYAPEIHDAYLSRGGTDYRPAKNTVAAEPPPPPKGLVLPPGATYIGPAQ